MAYDRYILWGRSTEKQRRRILQHSNYFNFLFGRKLVKEKASPCTPLHSLSIEQDKDSGRGLTKDA